MKAGRRFSPVRVMVAAQAATIAPAVWLVFSSANMTWIESGGIGSTILLVHSVNSLLLGVAALMERKWALLVLPVASWLFVCFLVGLSIKM